MYYDKISKRADRGDTPYNLRNCAYMDDFSKHKLVWTPVNSEYRFTVIPPDIFFNNSLFMITGEDIYKICGQLNSNLYVFYLGLLLSGNSYTYGSRDFFKDVPVYRANNVITEEIENLVKHALNSQSDDDLDFYTNQINQKVYDLFGINEEEKKYISNRISLIGRD